MTQTTRAALPTALEDAYARIDGEMLVIGNALIERRWRWHEGAFSVEAIEDKRLDASWAAVSGHAAPVAVRAQADAQVSYTVETGAQTAVSSPSLIVIAAVVDARYRFEVYPGVPAILVSASSSIAADDQDGEDAYDPSGVELVDAPPEDNALGDLADSFLLTDRNTRLRHVTFADQTDIHNELVQEANYRSHPSEARIALRGNLFAFERLLSSGGLAFLRLGPLPHARSEHAPVDFVVERGQKVTIHGVVSNASEWGDRWATLAYDGTSEGLTRALRSLQRALRGVKPGRDGLFLTNTWGDRGQDGRVNEAFLLAEIAVAKRLGVDVVQIDDGWQAGLSANSVKRGGIWEGFQADKAFWTPHPERFPNGLEPIVAAANAAGIGLGLWYAPDSSDDFSHWQDDVDTILRLNKTYGVRAFKVDGINLRSPIGRERLYRMFETIREESHGLVVCDLDVTAQVRPGYFGAPEVGPIFVENRYTDWPNYYPHATLRNLWSLARYIDPVRLRMELLNNARNPEMYGDDPLAPVNYDPAYLFASTMVASPLGWFEMTGLSESYIERLAPLVALWRTYRDEIRGGAVLPVGEQPDGSTWTGFVVEADGAEALHLIAFRELSEYDWSMYELPVDVTGWKVETLFGDGKVAARDDVARVHLDNQLSFVWARLSA